MEFERKIEDGKDKVHVRLPLTAASEALGAWNGRHLDTTVLLGALKHAKGELVHVADGDTEVSIRVW